MKDSFVNTITNDKSFSVLTKYTWQVKSFLFSKTSSYAKTSGNLKREAQFAKFRTKLRSFQQIVGELVIWFYLLGRYGTAEKYGFRFRFRSVHVSSDPVFWFGHIINKTSRKIRNRLTPLLRFPLYRLLGLCPHFIDSPISLHDSSG